MNGLKTFALGYTVISITILGGATVVPELPATISTVALKLTMEANIATVSLGMYATKNPERMENLLGAGISFIQGLTVGITNTKNVPDFDGTYSPGNIFMNTISGKTGEYLGEKIRENYVER